MMTKKNQELIANLEVKHEDLGLWWNRTNELLDDLSNRTTIIRDRFTKRAEEHGDLKSDT